MISVRLISSSTQLEMQLVGDRQAEQIGDRRAVERREQRDRHVGTELRRIGHVGEHLHHADQRADHAEGRRAVADGAIDLLAFVEMGQKVVAVALEVVANESWRRSRRRRSACPWRGTDPRSPPFRARSGPACGRSRQGRAISSTSSRWVHAPHGEGELHAHRQAVEDRGQREADQGRGGGAAENHDEGVQVEEHPQVAAHQDERDAARRRRTTSPRPVEISMKHSNAQTGRDPVSRLLKPSRRGLKEL